MDVEELRLRVNQIRWFHKYELLPGVITPGSSDMIERGPYFQIPADLTGKRVLDIGCADGYFTFLAESRGASVVSIDAWPRQGYFLAHDVLNSKADFRHMNVYDVHPDTLGMFDIVFFLGVYYHLKNPILALERIAGVTREYAIIESEIMPPHAPDRAGLRKRLAQAIWIDRLDVCEDTAVSRFYEEDRLGGDPTNWWVPNVPCLMQTIRSAGFPCVELVARYHERRGIVRAHKGPRTAGKMLTEDYFVGIDDSPGGLRAVGTMCITGIALSQLEPATGIRRVGVYLDKLDDPASELGEAVYGLWRADQTIHFGDQYGAVGFRFEWNTAGVAPGKHTLYIMVEGDKGWQYRSVPVVVENERR